MVYMTLTWEMFFGIWSNSCVFSKSKQTQNPHLINILINLILQELRGQCTKFATSLLDHTRSSTELEILLNHDPTGPVYQHGDRMHLNRLKLAIKYRQKKVGIIFEFELFD